MQVLGEYPPPCLFRLLETTSQKMQDSSLNSCPVIGRMKVEEKEPWLGPHRAGGPAQECLLRGAGWACLPGFPGP